MDRRTDCPERTASRDMFPQFIPLFNEKFRPVPSPMIAYCSSKPRACANPVLYHQASISGDATGTKTTRTIRPNFATQQTDSGIGDLRPQASEEWSFPPAPSQKYPPLERYRYSTIRDVASGDSGECRGGLGALHLTAIHSSPPAGNANASPIVGYHSGKG